MALQDFFAGHGTEVDPLLIRSTEDWDMMASLYNEGRLDYQYYWFRLENDISVTTMMGTADHPYPARFDGGGHTLTFNAENTDGSVRVAPFAYVSGVTIRNLRTAGSITGSADRASGLIGENGSPSVVQNCRVSMSVSGRDCVGGFCIGDGSGITFTGCVFDGTITAGTQSGGFVGWTKGSLVFTDCLFAPASSSASGARHPFYYLNAGSDTAQITNCYFLPAFESAWERYGDKVEFLMVALRELSTGAAPGDKEVQQWVNMAVRKLGPLVV